jgi:hypothetical protein
MMIIIKMRKIKFTNQRCLALYAAHLMNVMHSLVATSLHERVLFGFVHPCRLQLCTGVSWMIDDGDDASEEITV